MTIDPGRQTGALHVLVVEDETLVALLLESMLEDLGHIVVGVAANIGDGLAMASQEEIDLAILDVNVGGQESYPVAAALAARNVPFVFATGYEPARVRGAYADRIVLQKPFRQAELEKAIGQTVR
jgi:CheY-like chemotaxis protein